MCEIDATATGAIKARREIGIMEPLLQFNWSPAWERALVARLR
jgi:hypothetical protein